MKQKKESKIAGMAIAILLLIGIICYAGFIPAKKSKETVEPLRLMYKTSAGKVLFDHKTHANKSGYNIECTDCHHHNEDSMTSCATCHLKDVEPGKTPDRCLECHNISDIEGAIVKNYADTLHEQCIECHKESGLGPVECSQCHIM